MILQDYPVALSYKKQIAENTIELTFSFSDESFLFEAGQYISVCIPSLKSERVPDRCHDFSIVSSPLKEKEISIAFRVSDSIFKSALLSLSTGDVVTVSGPKGVLTLPQSFSGSPDVVFVAGGIGITPLLSMLRYATETLSLQKITLLYFNTSSNKTAYHKELLELQKINKYFIFFEIIGVPNEEHFVSRIKDQRNSLWYIVGAPSMVVLTRQILIGTGILSTQIKFEEFSGYER